MDEHTMSRVMFWVGLMFVLTPLAVIAVVVLTTRHLRKRRRQPDAQETP
jgi:hypothetical protein